MLFRRHIAALLFALMLCMQALVAQHYTVHFAEQTGQHRPDDGHDKDADACEICIVAKKIGTGFNTPSVILTAPVFASDAYQDLYIAFRLDAEKTVYAARAPPADLS